VGAKAVVLVSGGMDSCVTATLASKTHELCLLHVTYGQRTAERERRAFEDVARALKARATMVIPIQHLTAIGGSSLTDHARDVEVFDASKIASGIPGTYVPFRNGNLLAMAVSWAEVVGADSVWIGAVQQDSSGYPDCRREFLEAFEKAVALGTKPETRLAIRAPLLDLTKAQIVKKAIEIGAPLELTWSCYTESDRACGVCESCGLRLRGFAEAGAKDPIPYR
jgi:7-cyano-7-deazaguanine synthase